MTNPVECKHIVDTEKSCHYCWGRGVRKEGTGRGTFLLEKCDHCDGTGHKTVLVFTPKEI